MTDAAPAPSETRAERRAKRAKKHAAKRRFRLVWLPFWAGAGLVALILLAVAVVAVIANAGR